MERLFNAKIMPDLQDLAGVKLHLDCVGLAFIDLCEAEISWLIFILYLFFANLVADVLGSLDPSQNLQFLLCLL